jgi:hypothetical protein
MACAKEIALANFLQGLNTANWLSAAVSAKNNALKPLAALPSSQ